MNKYPSLSVNFLALSKLFDVDINPYISINTPGYKLLKSLILSLAPLYNSIFGILPLYSFTDSW